MFYTVYKITNLTNGKFYIGKHQTMNPNDGYMGSGKYITRAIKKYGRDNFTKEILFIFETESEMNAKEIELVTEEFVNCVTNYNCAVGGEGGPHFKGKKHSKETKDFLKEKNTGKIISTETKKKLSMVARNKIISQETRKKMSETRIERGIGHTPESKEKIRQSLIGRNHSEETKEKMRRAKLGKKRKPFSEEHRKKISEKAKERYNKNKEDN